MTLAVAVVILGIVALIGVAVAMTGGGEEPAGDGPGRSTATNGDAVAGTDDGDGTQATTPAAVSAPGAPGATRVDADHSAPEVYRETLDESFIDFTAATVHEGPASCTVTGLRGDNSNDYAVDAMITNVDDITSAYRMQYELFGPDGTSLGTDYGVIGQIEPGQAVVDDTVGIIGSDTTWDSVGCEVLVVLRIDAL